MKNRFLWKTLCILLIFALLARCEEPDVDVPGTSNITKLYDPEIVGDEFAIIGFSPNHLSCQNAEGKELHWPDDEMWPPTGNMKAFLYYHAGLDPDVDIAAPYSKSFTVQTRSFPPKYRGYRTGFSARFFKDGFYVSDIEVYGSFEGTATLWDDNVVEFAGNNSDISVTFTVHEKTESRFYFDSQTYQYELQGNGADHAWISLVDDEIIAEGMMGKYTVTKTDCNTNEVIYSKEYDGDTPPET